ncbi:MAG: SNF2-related protein [Exilispira sp.]
MFDISLFDSIEEKIIIETGESYFKKNYLKDFDIQLNAEDILYLTGNLLIDDKSFSPEVSIHLPDGSFSNSFCTCEDFGEFCSHRAALVFKFINDSKYFLNDDNTINIENFTNYKRNLSKIKFFKSIQRINEKYSIKLILLIDDFFNHGLQFKIDFYRNDTKINFYTDISYNEKWDEQRNFNYTLFPMKDRLIIKTIQDWLEQIPEEDHPVPKDKIDQFIKLISDFPELYYSKDKKFSISKDYIKPNLIVRYTEKNGVVNVKFDSNIKIIDGNFHQWVLQDNVLYPLRIKLPESVWNFLIKDSIILDQSEIADFYYDVIPKISHSFNIDFKGTIELKNVKNNSYYFDFDYDGNIIITPKLAIYCDDDIPCIYEFVFGSSENIYITLFKNNKYFVCKRNLLQEKKILIILKQYNFVLVNNKFIQTDKIKFKTFLEEGLQKIKREGEVNFSEEFKKIMIEKNYITVDLNFEFDEEENSVLKIHEYYYLSDGTKINSDSIDKIVANKRFIEIQNTTTAIENHNEIRQLKNLFYSVSSNSKKLPEQFITKIYISHFLYLYDEIFKIKENSPETKISITLPQKLEKMVYLRNSFVKNNDISVFKKKVSIPPNVKDILRGYQKFGFFWFHFLKEFNFGGILADDMGLGKTLQVLTFIKSLDSAKPSLIICPTSLLFNWENEINKFFPNTKILTVKGNINERKTAISHINRYEIVITSYSLIRNDIELYEIYDFECIVLDEANHIKNPNTNVSNAVKQLNGNYRFVLTGTPVENNLAELWSIFSFVSPMLLGKFKPFKDYYIDNYTDDKLEELKSKISPFILRRVKDDVLKELPPKIIQTFNSELTEVQKSMYQEILLEVKENIMNRIRRDGLQKSKIHILTALLKLRQIANHPGLLNRALLNKEEVSGKTELLKEILIESIDSGHKIIIFSQFTQMLSILEKVIKSLEFDYSYLDGSIPENKRQEEVRKFKQTNVPIFLISLRAGGYGLNLPEADIVVIFDPWWNPMVEMQAIDRCHRIGQTKTVNVYKLISNNTVEEKILQLQEKKKKLFESVMNVNNIFKDLTEEDVEDFFT